MNLQRRNTRNLNLKEENSSCFIYRNYSGLLLKSLFNSVLPHFLFFCYQTSSFCITLSFHALQLAYVEKVHLPLLGDDSGVVIVGLLILIISDELLWQAGLWHVETCLKTCLELPKSHYLIFLYSNLMESIQRFPKVRCSPVEQ